MAWRGEIRGTRAEGAFRDEEVGQPTTPLGACPESARMVYRVRLITSPGCTMMQFAIADFYSVCTTDRRFDGRFDHVPITCISHFQSGKDIGTPHLN
jgi:hypothetical protein